MKLSDLDWIVGQWVGEVDGDSIAESYEPAVAGQMLGWMRWWNNDAIKLYEFIIVNEVGDGLEMLIRHLRANGTSIEPTDAPIRFVLDIRDGQYARWRQVETDDTTTLEWVRRGDDLEATLTVDGKATTFRYHLG